MTALAEVPPLVPTLSSLAHDVNTEHAAIKANDADSLERAIRAGERLVQAKRMCPKGQWRSWRSENVDVPQQIAHQYMTLARHKLAVWKCPSIEDALGSLRYRDLARQHTAVQQTGRHGWAVRLAEDGQSTQQIAEMLGISTTQAQRLANPPSREERARENMERRRRSAEAKKALAEKNERAAVKRHGGQPEVIYTSILKACESAGRLIEEKPEHKAATDAILADLYRAKDKVLALIGAS